MPRGRSLSCFNIPSHNSTTLTYNTAYTNIGELLAQNEIKSADGILGTHLQSHDIRTHYKTTQSDSKQPPTGKHKQRPHSDGSAGLYHIEKLLSLYPWYHGNTDRQTAETMVLGKRKETQNGTFIVRKSGTRSGQHVITFNNNSQPTHLQITFDYSGRCKLKSQWFDSIFDMLEHYRVHLLPVESARHSQITLGGYVNNLGMMNSKHEIK